MIKKSLFLMLILIFTIACSKDGEFGAGAIASNTPVTDSTPEEELFLDPLEVTINKSTSETVGTCVFSPVSGTATAPGFSYRISFSKAIDTNSFSLMDIYNAGTGGSASLVWMITNCGDDKNFNLTATALVGDGTIIPQILGDLVQDTEGNKNNPSTAIDNTVTYQAAVVVSAYTPMVSAGLSHSCALNSTGEVYCWGSNSSGQLGYDDTNDRGDDVGEMASLVAVGLGGPAVKVVTGYYHSCALFADDTIKCWGENGAGQLGYGDSNDRGDTAGEMAALTSISFGQGIQDLVAGGYVTCAILADSTLKCWGNNGYGQLGQGDVVHRGANPGDLAALAAIGVGTVKKVGIGGSHVCAILSDDSVKCWGRNNNGQLGYDNMLQLGDDAGEIAGLAAVNLGQGAKDIIGGERHTCAILADDSAKCWGWNPLGQLGQGHGNNIGDGVGEMATLTSIPFGQTVKQISGGYFTTCAILADDTLRCFGENDYGQLGLENTDYRGDDPGEIAALTAVPLGATVTSVSLGDGHVCSYLSNDTIKCMGNNWAGQLGADDTVQRGDDVGEMAALIALDFGP